MSKQRKALALVSGGLDSLLAAKVVLDQGMHVEGVNFYTGFCVEGHTHAIRKKDRKRPKRNNALWVAETLGIKLHLVDIVDEYKNVVINPKYGYGANLNPCLDCKIFMVQKALEWIRKEGFDFIVTGEVVGQRPKSQRKETMPIISAESGADDLLVRPLCAKNLPATKPEREGWLKREELFDFSGRSRKPQIALAKLFGFEDYAQPAGGCCFLTDRQYAVKLADLWKSRTDRRYELDDIMLLKVGRHLRPAGNYKIIIAREEGEGKFLQGYRNQYISLDTLSHPGPLALLDGSPNAADILQAARIITRFGKGRNAQSVDVEIRDPHKTQDEQIKLVSVEPFAAREIPNGWYL